MRTRRPVTAPPPSDDLETWDAPRLRTQLRLCRQQTAYLHRELATALKQAPMAPPEGSSEELLQLEVQSLRQRYATLKLHFDDAQATIGNLRFLLQFAHKAMGWPTNEDGSSTPWQGSLDVATEFMDELFKQLLTVAHPDKWSAGQDATVLAHELTLAIQAHRERLRG